MGAKMMTEERTVTINAIFNIKLISIDFIQINIIISTLRTLFMASLGIVGLVTLSQCCPVLRGQSFPDCKTKVQVVGILQPNKLLLVISSHHSASGLPR